jgi:pimeloyl-ACP methyl ester carboxylesterase
MKTVAFLLMTLVSAAASAQQKPTTGYAEVNGVKMYYEVHGSGEPVVLLHGAFMSITNNWTGWIGELSKTRKVIAVEMQGHGRTADIKRDITEENLADDVAALLEHLKIPRADLIGYSMGGAVAMQCAIRHPDKVRKVVVISSVFRRDGMVKEALDAIPKLTADDFKGSPIEDEYKKLSPTPDDFPNFVKRMIASASKGHDISADKLKATKAPMFFIHGDADGVRLEHIAEMFRLKGGEIHGDMKPRSASRLAILPDTTHVTLMQRMPVIVPMVSDFLDATADSVDPVGTWNCEYERGGVKLTSTLTIKKDGDKLAGTMSWPNQKETNLKDLKLKDDTLTFSAVRKIMDNEFTVDYKLTIDGDKLKGKGAGEFMGEKLEVDIEGKREKKDK